MFTTLEQAVQFYLLDEDVDYCRFIEHERMVNSKMEYNMEVEITYKDGSKGYLVRGHYGWTLSSPFVPSLTE
jgi:hypothetical protein